MSKSIPIQSFRIHEEGLARLFGELEAKVMESIWELQDQEPTVQTVCDYLGPGHNYKTVMTVLNRLVEKGALTRQRRSRAFIYLPKQSRDAFIGRASRLIFGGLLRDFGNLAVAQFVESLDEVDPAQLDELERLVRERREAQAADAEGTNVAQ
ncbi:MAG: BlaI/MecI/CopY family transcriptional regulator [Anaerolineae bacterium]|nr:BlaI/MecI/CopY family transcriptional regulator [Anaerolineae bacterium]MCB0198918.1 BlaI/MecI/CopY family transcriptional regulator [Anaerolineae bacterium]MCB0252807.1 BlaI/MecI/CopY family transcriptional regulator [Anaerolineae bacterium]